jgi:type I restriction enzyme R subunit
MSRGDFFEKKLQELLKVNSTKKNFVERLQKIINEYNSGGRTTEKAFDDLNSFKDDLAQEEQRHLIEGLTKEELELFDLLYKEKLTADERIKVKNAAKALLWKLRKISAEKPFWYKDTQEQAQVKGLIMDALCDDLSEIYDKPIFDKKCDDTYNLVYERTLSSGNAFYH